MQKGDREKIRSNALRVLNEVNDASQQGYIFFSTILRYRQRVGIVITMFCQLNVTKYKRVKEVIMRKE